MRDDEHWFELETLLVITVMLVALLEVTGFLWWIGAI